MSSKKTAKKPGRPKAQIDWARVTRMLHAQCDGVAIAGLLGIDPETLYNRCKVDNKMGFSEFAALKRGEGRELIKLKQFEVAMNAGDKTMLIYLGKVYCGQVEGAQSIDLTTGGLPLQITPISFLPQRAEPADDEE